MSQRISRNSSYEVEVFFTIFSVDIASFSFFYFEPCGELRGLGLVFKKILLHFLEKSLEIITFSIQEKLQLFLNETTLQLLDLAKQVEDLLLKNLTIEDDFLEEIHQFGTETVSALTTYILQIYPQLGIRASKLNEEINQIFRDFFTATQHRNFRQTFS